MSPGGTARHITARARGDLSEQADPSGRSAMEAPAAKYKNFRQPGVMAAGELPPSESACLLFGIGLRECFQFASLKTSQFQFVKITTLRCNIPVMQHPD